MKNLFADERNSVLYLIGAKLASRPRAKYGKYAHLYLAMRFIRIADRLDGATNGHLIDTQRGLANPDGNALTLFSADTNTRIQ